MTQRWMKRSSWITFGALALLTACQTNRLPQRQLASNYCAPTQPYRYDPAYAPRPDVETVLAANSGLTGRFSRHTLLMMNALGLLPQLRELVGLEGDSSQAALLRRLQVGQQLQSRLLLATTEIASLAAELDCEGERAEQLAYYLDQRDIRRVRNLTILSIVAGAVTTVATALIKPQTPNTVIGIGGGVLSAGLGGLAAFSSDRRVPLVHRRNLLTDIWNQSGTSTIYPSFIWYVLNEKAFSNSTSFTIAHNIRERWSGYILAGAETEGESLYFGSGGQYTADELHTRANMLNQLQSSVRSLSQDLQSLQLALVRY